MLYTEEEEKSDYLFDFKGYKEYEDSDVIMKKHDDDIYLKAKKDVEIGFYKDIKIEELIRAKIL